MYYLSISLILKVGEKGSKGREGVGRKGTAGTAGTGGTAFEKDFHIWKKKMKKINKYINSF